MNNRKMTQWQYALTLLPYDEGMTFDTLITMPKGALYRWIKKTKQIKQEARFDTNEELIQAYQILIEEQKPNLLEIAKNMTTLKKKGYYEWKGPCPICKQGHDRFHVNTRGEPWWYCRYCGIGGDTVGLVAEVHHLTQWEAAEELAGYSPRDKIAIAKKRTYSIITPDAPHSLIFPDLTAKFSTCRQIWKENSLTGKVYFEYKRGLLGLTVSQNRVGLIQTIRGLAIAYPCERLIDGSWQIVGINRRYLDNEKPKTKIVKGSKWGVYRLRRIRGAKALFLVEGEENALSVWQVVRAQDWPCDVVSVGSQGNFKSLRADITALAGEYQHLIIWADEQSIADEAIDLYCHKSSLAIYSPQLAGFEKALDANGLLLNGQLTEFLSCYLSQLSTSLVRKQKTKVTSKVTPVLPTDNTAREIEQDEQVRHNGQAPANTPSAIAPELANDPDFSLWAKYAREIEEDEQARAEVR